MALSTAHDSRNAGARARCSFRYDARIRLLAPSPQPMGKVQVGGCCEMIFRASNRPRLDFRIGAAPAPADGCA